MRLLFQTTLVLAFLASPLRASNNTTHWNIPGSGSWHDPANWSDLTVPTSSTGYVRIDYTPVGQSQPTCTVASSGAGNNGYVTNNNKLEVTAGTLSFTSYLYAYSSPPVGTTNMPGHITVATGATLDAIWTFLGFHYYSVLCAPGQNEFTNHGTHHGACVFLGFDEQTEGLYTLAGDLTLLSSAPVVLAVGWRGDGTFVQESGNVSMVSTSSVGLRSELFIPIDFPMGEIGDVSRLGEGNLKGQEGMYVMKGGELYVDRIYITPTSAEDTVTPSNNSKGTLEITNENSQANIYVANLLHLGKRSVLTGPETGVGNITLLGGPSGSPTKLKNFCLDGAQQDWRKMNLACDYTNGGGAKYVEIEAAGPAGVEDVPTTEVDQKSIYMLDTLTLGHDAGANGTVQVTIVDYSENQTTPSDEVLYVRTIVRYANVSLSSADAQRIFVAGSDGKFHSLLSFIPGDANLDERVTDADYTLWADNYGHTPASWGQGDFNQDAHVTDADYTIWADNYGAGTEQGMRATSQPTSEDAFVMTDEEEPEPPAVTYTTVDLGDGLTGYTFRVEDAAEASWAVDLTFSGVSGATIQQRLAFPDICDIVVDFSDDAEWYDSRPLAEYSKELDTWVFRMPFYPLQEGVAENVDGSYHAHLCTPGGEAYGSLNVVYIVSEGDVSWEGNIARQGVDYAVSGSTDE